MNRLLIVKVENRTPEIVGWGGTRTNTRMKTDLYGYFAICHMVSICILFEHFDDLPTINNYRFYHCVTTKIKWYSVIACEDPVQVVGSRNCWQTNIFWRILHCQTSWEICWRFAVGILDYIERRFDCFLSFPFREISIRKIALALAIPTLEYLRNTKFESFPVFKNGLDQAVNNTSVGTSILHDSRRSRGWCPHLSQFCREFLKDLPTWCRDQGLLHKLVKFINFLWTHFHPVNLARQAKLIREIVSQGFCLSKAGDFLKLVATKPLSLAKTWISHQPIYFTAMLTR